MTNTKELQVVERVEGTVLQPYQNRDVVRELTERLTAMHPNAKELGTAGVMAVAQVALMTGANPMPGSNGIHAWRDKDGNLKMMYGIGYWRGQGEYAGGIRWSIQPRPMTRQEMEKYGIQPTIKKYDKTYQVHAAICAGALWSEIRKAKALYREFGENPPLREVAEEVSVIGYAVVDESEYAKVGRSLSWTATERAERDMWRKLLPVIARQEDRELARNDNGTPSSYSDAPEWLDGYVRPDDPEVFEGQYEDVNDLLFGDSADEEPRPKVAVKEMVQKQDDFLGESEHQAGDPRDMGEPDEEFWTDRLSTATNSADFAQALYELNRAVFKSALQAKKAVDFIIGEYDPKRVNDYIGVMGKYAKTYGDTGDKKAAVNAAKKLFEKTNRPEPPEQPQQTALPIDAPEKTQAAEGAYN